MHKSKQVIRNGAEQMLHHPNKPYDFSKDVVLGEQCEELSRLLVTQLGAQITRCQEGELHKDFVGTTHNGTPFELEVKGDFKSIITGNIFIEFMNTRKDEHSGIMCGNEQCLWHHYFFTQGDCTRLHMLCTTKGFIRNLTQQYKDTHYFQPKTIHNARGYAVAQSLLFDVYKEMHSKGEQGLAILTHNL